MKIVNMHEAKTHLSKLVAEAVAGEPFVIARAGKPLVKVEVIRDEPKDKPRRLGFMMDQGSTWKIPEDFNSLMQDEINEMFNGEGDGTKFAGLDFPYPEPDDDDQRMVRPAGWQKEKAGS